MENKSTLSILLAAIIISSTLFSSFEVEPQVSYLSSNDGNSYSGNNSSGNNSSGNNSGGNATISSITITSPLNGSNVHQLSTTFRFDLENYTGYVYWNATNTDSPSSNTSFQTWYSYGSSNYNASGQGQGQGQGNHTYRSLLDGNYTICASLTSGEYDCISIWHTYVPTSINITSPSNNETIYHPAGNYTSFYFQVTNHSGYVYWNKTSLDNSSSNSTSTTYIGSSYVSSTGATYPKSVLLQAGNYTVCAYLNTGESDCVTFRVIFHPYSFEITNPSNGSTVNIANQFNVILNVNFTVTNYSGSMYWQLINHQSQNVSMYWWSSVASGYYWIYNMTTVNLSTNSSLRPSNQYAYLPEGNYTLCANLSTGDSRCVSFTILLPPVSVSIISPSNNALITEPQLNNNYVDYLRLEASINNYQGYIYWNSTSRDSSSNSSVTSWYSYISGNSNTTNTIHRVGYGNLTICAAIGGSNGTSINPNSSFSDCVDIEVVPRTAEVAISSIQSTSNSSQINSAYLYYNSNNHSHGYIYINGNQRGYIGSNFHSTLYNNSNNGSNNSGNGTSHNHASHYIHRNYLNHGNNTICVEVISEDDNRISHCITYFIPYPQYRLIIMSPANQSSFYNGQIDLSYVAENYSGIVYWTLSSPYGNMSTSSYASNYQRTVQFSPNFFGLIDICGFFNVNTTTTSQSCITINLVPRQVEGGITSPVNNSIVGSHITLTYWAQNFTQGELRINGNTIDTFGGNFSSDHNGHEGHNVSNNSSGNNSTFAIHDQAYIHLDYGISTICLVLSGENSTSLSDCINVNRIVPTHILQITDPANNSQIVSSNITITYLLRNSSSHYFTINGQNASIWSAGSNGIYSTIQIHTGFGNHTICLVSYDYTAQMDSECLDVSMLDPNMDTDLDGITDHIDSCPNTPSGETVDATGCSSSQLDDDNDGIMNDQDLCSNTPIQQNVDSNGCSASQRDTDGDGVSDLNDACPNTPIGAVANADGCSNSQLDSDNDGISDSVDLCPNTIVGSQVDSDGCANSQKDSDSDGVVDSFDQCPNTTLNTVVDQTGCPHSSSGGGSNSSSGSEEPSSGGLPGFEPLYLVISILFAIFVISRKKA